MNVHPRPAHRGGPHAPGPERDWNHRQVALGEITYPYYFGFDCADRIAWHVSQLEPDRCFVVTDDTVLRLHGDAMLSELGKHAPVKEMSLPPGEGIKTLRSLTGHLESAISAGATRRSVVIGFGGGVPGNLAGLIAGLLFRGVRLVHVPTTTVAAMDSTISLKQAVNSGHGKNHFGMYHAPAAVFTDVAFLQTLPAREMRSGLCEAAKNCLAIRPESIPTLRTLVSEGDLGSAGSLLALLDESLAAKLTVTATDAKEQARGLVLEYGHTIGHAVELCDHRLRGAAAISHGEAVAIGMLAAARISAAMGELSYDCVLLHDQLIAGLGAPSRIPGNVAASDVMDAVRLDNKRGYLSLRDTQAALVLLRDIGMPLGTPDCPLVAVELDLVGEMVAELADPARETA